MQTTPVIVLPRGRVVDGSRRNEDDDDIDSSSFGRSHSILLRHRPTLPRVIVVVVVAAAAAVDRGHEVFHYVPKPSEDGGARSRPPSGNRSSEWVVGGGDVGVDVDVDVVVVRDSPFPVVPCGDDRPPPPWSSPLRLREGSAASTSSGRDNRLRDPSDRDGRRRRRRRRDR